MIESPYKPPDADTSPKKGPSDAAKTAGGIAGAICGIGGYFLGRYAGGNFFVPLVIMFVIGAIALKLVPRRSMQMFPPFVIQFAHGCWILLALVVLRQFGLNIIDVVILLGASLWLVLRPGFAPVIVLAAYQMTLLFINANVLAQSQVGDPAHRAISVHISLRILALASMVFGLYQQQRGLDTDRIVTTQ